MVDAEAASAGRSKIANIVLNDFTNDSRVLKISNTLAEAGFDVVVVALHKDDLPETEQIYDFRVDRIRLKSADWPRRKFFQAFKYLEFIFRSVKRYRKFDAYHCNDLHALPIGVLLRLLSGGRSRLVYDAHEYETERYGSRGLMKLLDKLIERFFIRFADETLTVSESIALEYTRLYSISPRLVLNCPNYVVPRPQNIFRETFGIGEDQQIFLYQGGLSGGRGIELLLDTFASLGGTGNVLVCMGFGPLVDKVKSYADAHDSIFFHPSVAHDVLLDYTTSANFGILFYENTCLNHYYCSPNKMFEYLMAGLPVLTSNLYEMKRLVEKHQLGVVASDNTCEGFARAIKGSLELDYQQIKSNVESVRKIYCWEEQEKVLMRVYGGL